MNWLRFWLAIVFWVHENNYYGWNASPHSDGELIADGIVVLLLALAIRLGSKERA